MSRNDFYSAFNLTTIERLIPRVEYGINTMQRLFTYGTLSPNRENAHVLAEIEGQWSKGFVRGVVHILDWGPDRGLPAIVLDPQADKVAGYLLSSASLSNHLARIDAFEGFQYQRVAVEVELESGAQQRAWIYCMRPKQD